MADWKFKGKTVKETQFQERKLTSKTRNASLYPTQEETKLFFGEDTFTLKLEKTKLQTGMIFYEKFGEEIPENAELETKIQENYHNLKGSTVSSMTIGKRANEAKEKIRLKHHLAAEQQKLIERRKSDMELAEDRFEKVHLEAGKEEFKTEEEKEAFRQWAVFRKDKDIWDKFSSDLLQENTTFQDVTYSEIVRILHNTSLREFQNKDEAEFASAYAEKYEKICRLACADVFLDKYLSRKENDLVPYPIAELRAKIAFFKELKTQYEDRYLLLSSPYYALLRKSDMKEYLGSSGEAKAQAITDKKLKKYVLLYRKTMSTPLAMGKSLSTRFNALVNEYKRKQSEEDTARVAPILSEFEETLSHLPEAEEAPMLLPELEGALYENPEEQEEWIRLQHQLFRSRKAETKISYPVDDAEFLRTSEAQTGGEKVSSMEAEELAEVEKIFIEILEKKSVNGVKLSEAVLTELSGKLKDYMNIRREFHAMIKASDDVFKLAGGLGADLQNDVFRKTDAGKKLLRYATDELSTGFMDYSLALREKYGDALLRVMVVLQKHNVSCFPEYEKRIEEKADAALEAAREARENQDKKPFQYPHVTVNGQEILLYSTAKNGFITKLAGKSFDLPEKEGKELLSLMKRYAKESRKRTIVRQLFGLSDGIKGLVGTMHYESQLPVLQELESKIGEYLK